MDPNDLEEIDGLKAGDMSRLNLSWWQKLKLKYFPMSFLAGYAKAQGVEDGIIDKLNEVFRNAQTIDIIPTSAARGFIMVLDRKVSFWFYQNGDNFKYDGYEIGEYDKGDITIFDKLKD
ncbi:MAG TPA: hypothetical protein VE973_00420 [Candidatus Limnocylindria bacterium]|nr:hypothetical protein [Candidatus Limnocylindria bacterium]